MLLMANLANTKRCKETEKSLKSWHVGTHVRVLSESFPMNTSMAGLVGFQRTFRPCALDESSLSINRINPFMLGDVRDQCCLNLSLFLE